VPAAGCPPHLPIAGRAELQAGLVSNRSEGLMALKPGTLGWAVFTCHCLSRHWVPQRSTRPQCHQPQPTCQAARVCDRSQAPFKACGLKAGARPLSTGGLLVRALAGHALQAARSAAQTRNVLPKPRHLCVLSRRASSEYYHSLCCKFSF